MPGGRRWRVINEGREQGNAQKGKGGSNWTEALKRRSGKHGIECRRAADIWGLFYTFRKMWVGSRGPNQRRRGGRSCQKKKKKRAGPAFPLNPEGQGGQPTKE